MSTLIEVEEPSDPRLADYVDLRDVELRTSLEAEHGLFIAEGEKVIRRAVTAGYRVRSFLMAPRWVEGLRTEIEDSGAPCFLLGEASIEKLTGFHVHRGALASLERVPPRPVDQVVADAGRIVVLEDVVDHTNVGAIFRSAAAFGIDAIVLSPRCADPLYRRSIKVAMGAVFTVPYARMGQWYDGPQDLRSLGFTLLALTPARDARPLPDVVQRLRAERIGLVMGTEGAGLSPRWLESADERVTIPIDAEVDSLNVAAATAVACYVLTGGRGRGGR